ncbi:MAG: type II toxin-antitoxin system VapC family toxin [archaeon]|nr:type II toxin-antitoxin system VapC family toxin [archaeon]
MVYLDSNIFLYTILYDSKLNPKAKKAVSILSSVEEGRIKGTSSLLTWDEVVWVAWKLVGYEYALKASASILRMPNMNFVGVDERVILKAHELVERYKLKPRDAIHISTALLIGEKEIISDDEEFDVVKGIKRIPL